MKKKSVFVVESGRPLRRGEFNVKQARGVPVVRGDGWRTFGRLLHVSEFVHQDIRDMCSSRRVARGDRAEGRCSTQEEDGVRMERVCGGELGMVRQIWLFADGHTASNAPDLF